MYDAANVRKAAGEQAKILNYIMEHWTEMKPAIFGKELKEFLGHTPFQVLMGGLLGISCRIAGRLAVDGNFEFRASDGPGGGTILNLI